MSITFKGLVNVITPKKGATERTRFILEVKDDVGSGEVIGKGENNKVEEFDAGKERGKGEFNKLEG